LFFVVFALSRPCREIAAFLCNLGDRRWKAVHGGTPVNREILDVAQVWRHLDSHQLLSPQLIDIKAHRNLRHHDANTRKLPKDREAMRLYLLSQRVAREGEPRALKPRVNGVEILRAD
jgi:hypothetical protein